MGKVSEKGEERKETGERKLGRNEKWGEKRGKREREREARREKEEENEEKTLGRKERGNPGKRSEERTKTINSMMYMSVFCSCWQGYTEAAGCSGRWW